MASKKEEGGGTNDNPFESSDDGDDDDDDDATNIMTTTRGENDADGRGGDRSCNNNDMPLLQASASNRSAGSGDKLIPPGQSTAQQHSVGPFGSSKNNNNNHSDRYTSDDDDLEAGPLTPEDIEEWHERESLGTAGGGGSLNNSLTGTIDGTAGDNNSIVEESFEESTNSLHGNNTNNNNAGGKEDSIGNGGGAGRDELLVSSVFTATTTSSATTQLADNYCNGNGKGGKKAYYNLSRAEERKQFMDIMNGDGGGGSVESNPGKEGKGDDDDEEESNAGSARRRNSSFNPFTDDGESDGDGNADERYASMQELLDDEKSRSGHMLDRGYRRKRRCGKLNCGCLDGCLGSSGMEKVIGPPKSKKRKIRSLGMVLLCVILVAAAVGVAVATMGRDDDDDGKDTEGIEGKRNDGAAAPTPNASPTRPATASLAGSSNKTENGTADNAPGEWSDNDHKLDFTFQTPSFVAADNSTSSNATTSSNAATNAVEGNQTASTAGPDAPVAAEGNGAEGYETTPTAIPGTPVDAPSLISVASVGPTGSMSPTSVPTRINTTTLSMRPSGVDDGMETTYPTPVTLSPTSEFTNMVVAVIQAPTLSPSGSSPARLSGECSVSAPAVDDASDSTTALSETLNTATTNEATKKQEVIISYQYTLITNTSPTPESLERMVTQLEDELHFSLLRDDKCAGGGALANSDASNSAGIVTKRNRAHGGRERRLGSLQQHNRKRQQQSSRRIQEEQAGTYNYQGFNSNPPDQISNDPCPDSVLVTLQDGQECYLIVGGITALVDESVVVIDGEGGTVDQSVIEDSVKSDTTILVKDVFSDPGSYETLEGVEEVIFEEIPALPIGTLAPTVSAMPSSSTTDGGTVSPTVSSPTMMPSASALPITSGPTPNGTLVDSVYGTATTTLNGTDSSNNTTNPTLAPSFASSLAPTVTLMPSSLSASNETSNATAPTMMPSASVSPTTIASIATNQTNNLNSTEEAGAPSFGPTTMAPTSTHAPSASILSSSVAPTITPIPSSSFSSVNNANSSTATNNGADEPLSLQNSTNNNGTDDTEIMAIPMPPSNSTTANTTTVSLLSLDELSAPYALSLSMESPASLSRHGFSVAISGDGTIIAVGAKDATDEQGVGLITASGAVYLYSMNAISAPSSLATDSLTLLQVIYGGGSGDEFGNAIALSNDGGRLVVGSRSENEQAGAMRIYQRNTDLLPTWTLMQGGIISGETPEGRAGWSVSISGDGNAVAMGSPRGGSAGWGSVHAFQYDDSASAKWDPYGAAIEGLTAGEAAGFSVSLSNTGSNMAVGSPKANNPEGDINAGKVAIYSMAGTQWSMLGKEIYGETETEIDGTSVALALDGSTLVIGGKGRNQFDATTGDKTATSVGYCRVFKYLGGEWDFQHSIMGQTDKERLGTMVAVSPTGNVVACGGVTGVNGNGITMGVVRLWNRDTLQESTIWPRGDGDDEAEGSTFGSSLALSDDGEYVVIGAPAWSDANDGGADAGAIQVFRNVM